MWGARFLGNPRRGLDLSFLSLREERIRVSTRNLGAEGGGRVQVWRVDRESQLVLL